MLQTTMARLSQSSALARKPDTLVVSGGGLKGIAALGAAAVLRRRGELSEVRTMVGTSAGALVCAALACGKEPRDVVAEIGPRSFKPNIDIASITCSYGLDSGAGLVDFIDLLLGERLTFEDVLIRHGVKLVVCVTNVATRSPEYLGPDTHPNMDVALALRMSCSLPLYFAAVHLGPEEVYVDGVMTDNFPCEWALANGSERVLGLRFKTMRGPVPTFEAYLTALAECAVRRGPVTTTKNMAVLELDLGSENGLVASLNFNASRKQVKALYNMGVCQAKEWLKKIV